VFTAFGCGASSAHCTALARSWRLKGLRSSGRSEPPSAAKAWAESRRSAKLSDEAGSPALGGRLNPLMPWGERHRSGADRSDRSCREQLAPRAHPRLRQPVAEALQLRGHVTPHVRSSSTTRIVRCAPVVTAEDPSLALQRGSSAAGPPIVSTLLQQRKNFPYNFRDRSCYNRMPSRINASVRLYCIVNVETGALLLLR
jgi:hypothetical protein